MKTFKGGFSTAFWLTVLGLVIIAGGLFWYINRGVVVPGPVSMVSSATTTMQEASSPVVASQDHTAEQGASVSAKTKTYTNEQLGFSFSYPSNLTVAVEGTPVYRVGGGSTVELSIYTIQGTDKILWGHVAVNQIIKDTAGPAAQQIDTSKMTVAGVETNQRLITDVQSGFKKIDEFFTKNSNTYELQFEYSTPQAQSIAHTIIASFTAN